MRILFSACYILTYFKEMQVVTVTFKRWLGSKL